MEIVGSVENESLRKELIEKQELLTQAAKAIELIEDQKQISTQSQTHYHQALKREHDKAEKLEQGSSNSAIVLEFSANGTYSNEW
uniref:Uncharacterized protein n=1 Tax=Trichogramma kaykai TaxID=54128 RepID=A0ABD2VU66_9HYME